MRQVQHFKRAIAMFAAIGAAMQLQGHERVAAMAKIEPYESRGKGHGFKPSDRHTGAAGIKRAARKARNIRARSPK